MKAVRLPLNLMLATALTGCVNVAPHSLNALPQELATHWRVADYKQLSTRLFPSRPDGRMKAFIQEVLDRNYDLKSISATARAAAFEAGAARAERWPNAEVQINGRRDKDILEDETGRSVHSIMNSASSGLDLNWTADVWGKLADEASAARSMSEKANMDWQQARRLLIVQSASTWIKYWHMVHTEKLLVSLNITYTNLRDHFRDAYEQGLAPYSFLLEATNSQVRVEDRLEEMKLARQKASYLMNTLRGSAPANEMPMPDEGIMLNLVAFSGEIPATALVDRYDIRASFLELRAFDYTAAAAHKALLPQIMLSGSATRKGLLLKKLFSGELIWQLVGGITQPLFNARQLKAFAEQKSAEAEASWWQFRNTVVTAMLEVENAMASEQSLVKQLEKKRNTVTDTENKLHSSEERLRDGELSLSDFLQIRVEHIEARIELAEKQTEYVENRLALVLAIGFPIESSFAERLRQLDQHREQS